MVLISKLDTERRECCFVTSQALTLGSALGLVLALAGRLVKGRL